ncbi:ABC transporter permease subunit [Nocardioides sp. dk4132]|uniref:ABC transporter permease subunit n=1 Tax=unclassified Nocardioides TaxID=2615069 RepID=UPI001297761A|nr:MULTISPECIES: ABC transporter permease subunit [unclassified Nocardioides]MQW76396.1 ABC transporter permease subunit [Nocardioides sp. dk4132]QGA07329.1 ABC transporter permease subunit [Nocardioides sp. dk884]
MTVLAPRARQVPGVRRVRRVPSLASPALLALPAVAFVVVFAVFPLADFAWRSIRVDGSFTLAHYREIAESSYFGDVLVRTVLTSMGVTACCVVLGYPLAVLLHRARGRTKILLAALVVLPYLTSVLVRVFAWSALLGLRGPVNRVLVALGVFEEPQQLGHSLTGAVIGLVHVLMPIAVLTMWATMSRIAPGHEVTAGALGASPVRVFTSVYWPLSRPGVAAGALLVYVLALGAYVIPVALGATNGLLFAQVVADQATVALNWPLAGAMTVAMLLAGVAPLVVVRLVLRRRRDPYPARQRLALRFVLPVLELVPAPVWRVLARVLALLVLAFLVIPELVVVVFSVGPTNRLSLPPDSLTLDGYRAFFDDPLWTTPMSRSFAFAAADGVLALVLGGLAAYGLVRAGGRALTLGLGLLVFPLALPEIVPALSFYVFANRFGLSGTSSGVVIGQAVTAISLAVVIIAAVVRNIDLDLEHASRMSGASRLRTLARVVVPLAMPGLLVGGLYAFLNAFDNLVLPLFVAGLNTTVPVRMFSQMQDTLSSTIAVVASLLIGLLLAATAVAVAVMSRAPARIDLADVASRK